MNPNTPPEHATITNLGSGRYRIEIELGHPEFNFIPIPPFNSFPDISHLIFFTEGSSSDPSAQTKFSNILLYEASTGPNTNVITAGGNSVSFLGRHYKTLETDYILTPNTILEFDFASAHQGNIHAIGWDTNSIAGPDGNSSHIYQLFGTDSSTFPDQRYHTYSSQDHFNPGTEHFVIPIGEDISVAGQFLNNLVLIHDSFYDPNYVGIGESFYSLFSNVELREKTEGSATVNGNDEIEISGSASRSIDIANHTITPQTVLKFDFQSNQSLPGLLHTIGWDTNDTPAADGSDLQNANRAEYAIFGSDLPGSLPYTTYDANGPSVQEISIHIGQLLHNGQSAVGKAISHLTFSTQGGANGLSANSIFSNIRFEEEQTVPLNGTYTVPTPDQIRLEGTIARSLAIPTYTITPNTVLRYTFSSSNQGALHRIGWDNDNSYNDAGDKHKIYPVWGTEIDARYPGFSTQFDTYQGGTDTIELPIGAITINGASSVGGQISRLLFTVEGDVLGSTATSIFSDIELFEDVPWAPPEVVGSGPGAELRLTGTSYQTLPIGANYQVTENTKLSFDFRSNKKGLQHGIGLDNNSTFSNPADLDNLITLFGTAGVSIPEFQYLDAHLQTWRHFEIPIGIYTAFQGSFNRLVFFSNDPDNVPDVTSWFRNIRLYEDVG
ncbi:MAG: hypothetical protein MI725_07615, partial [Pirellulales bacterium]|nr:hypothetical protein [Pirellulales bacterium]